MATSPRQLLEAGRRRRAAALPAWLGESSPRRTRPAASLALALALALSCAACGRGAPDPPAISGASVGRAPLEVAARRERAAARFERVDYAGARSELAPLVAGADAATEDLLRAAAVEFAAHRAPEAAALLARVGDDDPAAAYLRGRLALEDGRPAAALAPLARARERAPDDLPTRLALAEALKALGREDEARAELRGIVERGLEQGGSWYLAALYRLERLTRLAGELDVADALAARWAELAQAGARAPSDAILRMGELGRVRPARPTGSVTVPLAEAPAFEAAPLALAELADARVVELRAVELCDVDGDVRPDLLLRGAAGVSWARAGAEGWSLAPIVGGAFDAHCAFDVDNDGDLDLALFDAAGARLLLQEPDGWRAAPGALPALAAPPADVEALDFDHEGDLDLLLVGAFGARLWRNDGAWVEGGAFTDASEAAGLPVAPAFAWCASEDLDGDNDVDLLCGGPDGAYLADSLRAGRFADASARLPRAAAAAREPHLADFDADGRPDLWLAGGALFAQREDGSFAAAPEAGSAPPDAVSVDLDLDGALDLVGDGQALLAAGLPQARRTALDGWPTDGPARALAFADLDGDLRIDAFRLGARAEVLSGRSPAGNALRVRLLGRKDNRRAVGAVLEVRAGGMYRRVYVRGEPLWIGAGPHRAFDVVRVRWPNGVVQTALDRDLADQTTADAGGGLDGADGFVQTEGLVGSCPFLYTCDGERMVFVTDVLGITPLGLPMAPGRMVPFDHDEYVLVRGDQLRPRDGRLELAITEELREVTYLDRVRLDVVDHPAGTEVFPDERFTFPPFPAPHLHAVRDPLPPLRATGSDGRDWTAALAARDDVHAVPFERAPPQFLGLAAPWFVELEFDRARVAAAPRLRLVLTGWFLWSDASVNVAAARHPGVDFVPPILQVPDGDGGWRDAGPPVGFPAGKTKTMVLDVDGLGLRADPRLRVRTTLALHWDRVALAVCGDDAPLSVTALEPADARLWERGFSAPLPAARADLPERFDWDRLADRPRWDMHPGRYTRLGDCRELLLAIDDRYAILGAGDALSIGFDARALPPPAPGTVRDYVLFLDGWAKDRDPNTVAALEVEPLPFHGMSGYPPPAGERFPDDAAHAAWRADWNVRPARRWIAPLAPGAAGPRR